MYNSLQKKNEDGLKQAHWSQIYYLNSDDAVNVIEKLEYAPTNELPVIYWYCYRILQCRKNIFHYHLWWYKKLKKWNGVGSIDGEGIKTCQITL